MQRKLVVEKWFGLGWVGLAVDAERVSRETLKRVSYCRAPSSRAKSGGEGESAWCGVV